MVYCYKFPTLSLIIVSFWGEWGSNCVVQPGLKCATLLPHLSQLWDYRHSTLELVNIS